MKETHAVLADVEKLIKLTVIYEGIIRDQDKLDYDSKDYDTKYKELQNKREEIETRAIDQGSHKKVEDPFSLYRILITGVCQ